MFSAADVIVLGVAQRLMVLGLPQQRAVNAGETATRWLAEDNQVRHFLWDNMRGLPPARLLVTAEGARVESPPAATEYEAAVSLDLTRLAQDVLSKLYRGQR